MAERELNRAMVYGTFDWVNDDYSVVIVDDTYSTWNTDYFLSDLQASGAIQGVSAPVVNKSIQEDSSQFTACGDLTLSFGVIAVGPTLDAVIIYRDTGVPETSYLAGRLTATNVTGLPYDATAVVVDLDMPPFASIPSLGRYLEINT